MMVRIHFYLGSEAPQQDSLTIDSSNPWQPSNEIGLAQEQLLSNLAPPLASNSKAKTKSQLPMVSHIPVRDKKSASASSSRLRAHGTHGLQRTYSKKMGNLRGTYSKKNVRKERQQSISAGTDSRKKNGSQTNINHDTPAELADRYVQM